MKLRTGRQAKDGTSFQEPCKERGIEPMSPEKANEKSTVNPSKRHAEKIMERLRDYLSIRFDMIARVNPTLEPIKDDLMYHELENVRHCLEGTKIYGPTRMCVADVFLSDNEKRRSDLMSPTDQTSIQVELVSHCQDERVESTRGQIRFHDLKSFYAAINPSLSGVIDLFETWIWWDIRDAAELVRFEQKLGIISRIRQGKFSPEMRKRYATLIQSSSGGDEDDQAGSAAMITEEEILTYEINQLQRTRDQWAQRREYERGYMYVLRRDEIPLVQKGEVIHTIAEKVREYDTIKNTDMMNDEVRYRYASILRVAPDKVEKENILDYLRNELYEDERRMVASAEHKVKLGPPYRYKARQLEQMNKWLGDLEEQMAGGGGTEGVTANAAG